VIVFVKTLEACVKNCGKRFQQEIGKFKFLNELIKVVSPKVWFDVLFVQYYVLQVKFY
jgi:VHS domain